MMLLRAALRKLRHILDRIFSLVLSRYPAERKWVVDGSIRLVDIPGSYYLDVSKQEVTKRCLHAVECSQFVLLSGPRASGKSTRLNMLAHILSARGYEVIKYVATKFVVPLLMTTIDKSYLSIRKSGRFHGDILGYLQLLFSPLPQDFKSS